VRTLATHYFVQPLLQRDAIALTRCGIRDPGLPLRT
jgi:hypothetical protein